MRAIYEKKLMLTAAILLVAGLGLGAVCAYQYFRLHQECARMMERADDTARTGVSATGTAQAATLKKDAADAQKGGVFVCEDSRSRQKNYLAAGLVALVLIVIAAAPLMFSRRTRPAA